MKPVLLGMAVLSGIGTIVASAAEPESPKDEPLVTWVGRVSISVFANREGTPDIRIPMPPTAGGQKRWNVAPFLDEKFGVKFGGDAILLEDGWLVAAVKPKAAWLLERLFGEEKFGPSQIDFEASLWEFTPPPENEPAPRVHRFQQLKESAGDSLRKLSEVSLITKSGNRAVALSQQNSSEEKEVRSPPSISPNLGPHPEGFGETGGAIFELEPVIGPDGLTVDVQFRYQCRHPENGISPELSVDVVSNVSLRSGSDSIVYISPVPSSGSAPKQIALVLRANITETDARDPATRDADMDRRRQAHDAIIIKRARDGLPARL